MASKSNPTTPAVRAWMREQQRQWRRQHPERAQLYQLRSCRNILERHGFVVTGGDIDLQTGQPINTDRPQGSTQGSEEV